MIFYCISIINVAPNYHLSDGSLLFLITVLILADILHYFINFSQILVIFLYFVTLVWNIFFMF